MEKKLDDGIEIIAKEIESLSAAISKIKSGRLTENAIVTLIYEALPSGKFNRGKACGKPAIREVLLAASNLKTYYIKKTKETVNANIG